MVAQSAPTMKKQRTLSFSLLIGEMDIVEPPSGVHSGNLCIGFLLPVEPPEVDALLFERMVQQVHIICGEFFVGNIEWHIFLRGWIDADGFCHSRVRRLPRLHARCGM